MLGFADIYSFPTELGVSGAALQIQSVVYFCVLWVFGGTLITLRCVVGNAFKNISELHEHVMSCHFLRRLLRTTDRRLSRSVRRS